MSEPQAKPRGTCPVCFGDYARKGNKMFRHGYQAPGRGSGYAPHVGGYCAATGRFDCLENSPAGTIWLLGQIADELAALDQLLADLRSGEVTELLIEVIPGEGERRPCFSMATQSLVETGEIRPMYGTPRSWASVLTYAISSTEYKIRAYKAQMVKAEQLLRAFWPSTDYTGASSATEEA